MLENDQRRIVVISGPSGTGKSTLIKKLLDLHKNTLHFSISTTTRSQRPTEIDGVDYHFLTEIQFRQRASEGYFLETANVHGHLYGTSKDAIEHTLALGTENRCLLDIDVQGALSVLNNYPKATRIFILPPSLQELERRLRSRGDTKDTDVQVRLRNAIQELSFITAYNYFVVNTHQDLALKELEIAIYGKIQ